MSNGLIGLFARHRLLANLLMGLLLILGVVAIGRMNVQFFPPFALDVVSVRVVWSGAAAEDVETGLVEPLEERLKGIDGVKRITATAAQGIASLSLELHEGADPLAAVEQVRQRVAEFRNLPQAAEKPQITRLAVYEPIASLLVQGPNLADLRPWVQRFERELQARGIAQITISGLPRERIAIEVPSRELEALGLSLDGIGGQIGRLARDIPAGILGEADGARELRGLEQRREALGFEDLPIVSDARGLLRLGDVATITREPRPGNLTLSQIVPASAPNNDATPASVELLIQRAETGNTLEAARIFDEWLNETRPTLPPSIRLYTFDTRWEEVDSRINLLIRNGIQGLLLVLVLLYVFLPGNVAFWVAMGIPVAYMTALTLLWAWGGTINMISLFALLLTLGIINDDAIVVGEYAETRFRQGLSPVEAAIAGARRMFWPVTAAALTTVAAFLPLIIVGGTMGNILGDIPLVAILVLMASLLEVFLIMPAHLRGAFTRHRDDVPPRWRKRVDAGFTHVRDQLYRPLLMLTLRWRLTTVSLVVALTLLTAGLLAGGRVPFLFFPTPESQVIYANVTFVAGTPREQTARFLDELQRTLLETEQEFAGESDGRLIQTAIARLGSTRSGGFGSGPSGDQLASIYLELIEPDRRRVRNPVFINAWRERLSRPPGLENLSITARQAGPPGRDLTVRLTGNDPAALKTAALELAESLTGIAGVSELQDDLPYGREQLIYRLTPVGEALGLTVESLGRQLRAAFDGYLAQLVQSGEDELEVRVLLPRSEREHLESLEQLSIRTPDGRFVPLTSVARWEARQGFEALRHADGRLAVEVTADIDSAVTTRDRISTTIGEDLLPRLAANYGIDYSFEGQSADQRETLADMRLGLILGLGIIYAILAAVFSSWGWPLVVMTAIPLGLIGAIIGHWLMGLELTLLSLFGLFGLSGIVVNNAIILVSMYQELRTQGMDTETALIEAAASRLRAMLLTSATTIVGLIPLLFETSLQAQFLIPMAVSLAFGVGFATVLVLVFTPALLALHEGMHQRLGDWRRRGTVHDTVH